MHTAMTTPASPLSPDFGDHAPRVEAAICRWFKAGGDMAEIAKTIGVDRLAVEEVIRRAMKDGKKS